MAVTTSGLTNTTLAESGDSSNWDDKSGGPGSGQQSDFPIQGSEYRARRADNATDSGFAYDNVTGLDCEDGIHVGVWALILQPALTTELQIYIGGGASFETSPWAAYIAFASAGRAYPAVGGWQRVWVDARNTPDDSAGTLDIGSIRQYGIRYTVGNVGGTTPNAAQDRTDRVTLGGGLLGDAGTVTVPVIFQDFVDEDEGNSTNAYGIVITKDGVIFCQGRLIIADATATVFNDSGVALVFGDQRLCADDWMGITIDVQNTSTDVDIASTLFRSGGTEKLGDFKVTDSDAGIGTGAAVDLDSCTFDALRRLMFIEKTTLLNAVITNCGQITLLNSEYTGNLSLPGTDEYADTQETFSVNSTSGDFEIIANVRLDDITPTTFNSILTHGDNGATTTEFEFGINTSGFPSLTIGNGTNTVTAVSITAMRDRWLNTPIWLRVRYDASVGTTDFFWSIQPLDTPPDDITWNSAGNPNPGIRVMGSTARIFQIGATGVTTPTDFFDGEINYVELWTDGTHDLSNLGDMILRADWRTGPAFTGTPATRVDDFDGTNMTWELQGSSPSYTQGHDLDNAVADISGSTISNSIATSALLWEFDVDPLTNGEIDNIDFISGGTGHAIELRPNTPSTITLTGQTYTGYATSDGSTGDEVIYNNSNKSITINIVGGDTPTIRNGAGASTTVVASVTLTVNVNDRDGNPVEGARVRVEDDPLGTLVEDGQTNASGVYSESTSYTVDNDVFVVVRLKGYLPQRLTGTITGDGLTVNVTFIEDEIVNLP